MYVKEPDEKTSPSWWSRLCRLTLIVVVTLGMVCSLFAASSCELVEIKRTFDLGDAFDDALVPENPIENGTDVLLLTSATFGLYRWNPENAGCRKYKLNNFDASFKTARVGGLIGMALGIAALCMLIIEFVVCRYPCSRQITTGTLILAFLFQCFTFLIYANDLCMAEDGRPYQCSMDRGTAISIAATIFYFISLIMVCCTPKEKPLIQQFMERDRNKEKEKNDTCCYFCKKKEPEEEEGDEIEGEEEEGDEETGTAVVAAAAEGETPESQHSNAAAAAAIVPVPVPVPVASSSGLKHLTFSATMKDKPEVKCMVTMTDLDNKTLKDLTAEIRNHPIGKAFFRQNKEIVSSIHSEIKLLLMTIDVENYHLEVYRQQFEKYILGDIASDIITTQKTDLTFVPVVFSIEDALVGNESDEDIFEEDDAPIEEEEAPTTDAVDSTTESAAKKKWWKLREKEKKEEKEESED